MATQLTKGQAQAGSFRANSGEVEFDDLQRKVIRARFEPGDIDAGNEVDLGVDLPDDALVEAVFLDVRTAEATGTTKTVDVGLLSTETGGDADGFLDAASVSAAGLVKGTLDSGGQTLGALLTVDESGAGVLAPEPHLSRSVTAKSISLTPGSNDFEELAVDVYIVCWLVEEE